MRDAIMDIIVFLDSLETQAVFSKDEFGYFLEWECGNNITRLAIYRQPYLTSYRKGKRVHAYKFVSAEDLMANHNKHILKTLERK